MVPSVEIVVEYFEGCAAWRSAVERVRDALARLGLSDVRVSHRLVEGDAAFRGSPTILVDGHDPFPGPPVSVTLACRIYRTPHGLQAAPTVEQLVDVIAQGGRT